MQVSIGVDVGRIVLIARDHRCEDARTVKTRCSIRRAQDRGGNALPRHLRLRRHIGVHLGGWNRPDFEASLSRSADKEHQ